jgi:hypothetical protein
MAAEADASALHEVKSESKVIQRVTFLMGGVQASNIMLHHINWLILF